MAITQAICTSFKRELFLAIHDFDPSTGDTFRLALYNQSAELSALTTVYTTSNEIVGTGYTAGGYALTVSAAPASSGSTALVSFDDLALTGTDFTTYGGLIYNASKANRAVATLNFGGPRSSRDDGTFPITFPSPDALNAILRVQ